MPYLICYDIEDDKRRLKTANRLLQAGLMRMQKSVFFGDPREKTLKSLMAWLQKNVGTDPKTTDRVLVLSLTENQLKQALILGNPPEEWADLTDPPNTLII